MPGPGHYTVYSEFGMYDRSELPNERITVSRNSQLGMVAKTSRTGKSSGGIKIKSRNPTMTQQL